MIQSVAVGNAKNLFENTVSVLGVVPERVASPQFLSISGSLNSKQIKLDRQYKAIPESFAITNFQISRDVVLLMITYTWIIHFEVYFSLRSLQTQYTQDI